MKLINQLYLFGCIMLLASCSVNSEEILLQLDKNIGDEQIISCSTKTNSGSQISVDLLTEVSLKISEKKGDVYGFTMDVLRMKSETKMGKDIESYDSDKEESQMTSDEKSLHYDFKEILDSKFTFSMDNKGKITQPFLYENGRKVATPIVDMSNIQIIFPKNKVKVGTEWEYEKMNSMTSQKTVSVFRVEDITDNEIIISINSTIEGLFSMGDNKASGEYILDRKTCSLIKCSFEMDLQTGGKVTYTYTSK